MTNPYTYQQITESAISPKKGFSLLCDSEPICIFELNDDRMMHTLTNNLNSAYKLGIELGKQSIFTKELYTYGIELKNIYSLNMNETYNELLSANILEYEIILPDATTHALPDMNYKTANSFINLMNHAHRLGYSSGLSYSEVEYNTATELNG